MTRRNRLSGNPLRKVSGIPDFQPILRYFNNNTAAKICVITFACGPNGMLRALAALCREEQLACEVSLESVMGCGIGICYGCTVEVNNTDGGRRMLLLCQDGPVIDGRLLI